jgi:archaellum biogenesis ATPase FlaH
MKLESELPKSVKKIKLLCSLNLKKELKSLKAKKKTVVFIEKFFICLSLKENDIRTIVNDIASMVHSGLSVVITASPTLAASIPYMSNKLSNVLVFDIPPLSFEDTQKMVALRLNEIRKKKSDSITPFTENEILQVWRTANGNPKMILLLCASLYEAKGSS